MAIETTARGVVSRVASPARALVLVAGVALVAEGAQLWIKHLLLFVSTHLPAQAFTNDAHELPFGLPKAIAQVAPQAAEVRAGVFVGVCGRVPRQVDGLKQPLANQVTVDTESGLSSVGRHDIDLLAHPQRGVSWHTALNMHVITFGVKVCQLHAEIKQPLANQVTVNTESGLSSVEDTTLICWCTLSGA